MSEYDYESGPASPVADMSKTQCLGMSLRDWFAGQALVGLLSGGGYSLPVDVDAYRIADAMLEARDQHKTEGEAR